MKHQHGEGPAFGFACSDCTPKPDPKYKEMPLDYFLGKNVKVGVPTDPKPPDCPPDLQWPTHEHIWVAIGHIDPDSKEGELVGVINCEQGPFFLKAQGYVDGTLVGITRDEIEEVYEEE